MSYNTVEEGRHALVLAARTFIQTTLASLAALLPTAAAMDQDKLKAAGLALVLGGLAAAASRAQAFLRTRGWLGGMDG
jgi:hypothetical protein